MFLLRLVINGEEKNIDGAKTIEDLLRLLDYEKDAVAVALEGTFVSRSKYNEHQLQDAQEIEILMPMQGG